MASSRDRKYFFPMRGTNADQHRRDSCTIPRVRVVRCGGDVRANAEHRCKLARRRSRRSVEMGRHRFPAPAFRNMTSARTIPRVVPESTNSPSSDRRARRKRSRMARRSVRSRRDTATQDPVSCSEVWAGKRTTTPSDIVFIDDDVAAELREVRVHPARNSDTIGSHRARSCTWLIFCRTADSGILRFRFVASVRLPALLRVQSAQESFDKEKRCATLAAVLAPPSKANREAMAAFRCDRFR